MSRALIIFFQSGARPAAQGYIIGLRCTGVRCQGFLCLTNPEVSRERGKTNYIIKPTKRGVET